MKPGAEEGDIAREVSQTTGVVFANVFDPMMDVMIKAKAKYGPKYPLVGADGVHPDANGHLVMAYAFLKALGCSGEIGKISVDLAADRAEGSPGHKVVSCVKGAVELESTRYPFCFYGDPAEPSSTRGVLEFLPFNQDLNRFVLVVKNAPAGRVKVTWGETSKEFNALGLAEGINLAAEFLDNPFSAPFQKVEAGIRKQQTYETPLVKDLIHRLPAFKELVPEEADSLERIGASGIRRQKALLEEAAAGVVAVRHKLTIEPVQ